MSRWSKAQVTEYLIYTIKTIWPLLALFGVTVLLWVLFFQGVL